MHPGNTISSPTVRTGRALGHAVLRWSNVLARLASIVTASLLCPTARKTCFRLTSRRRGWRANAKTLERELSGGWW